MRPDADRGLVQRFFELQAKRSNDLAPGVYRQPASVYTSEDHLALERRRLFRDGVVVAGLSADAPEPGDWFTLTCDGLPVVVVRGEDGTAAAFVNSCRHRGARVAGQMGDGRMGDADRGHAGRGLICPYHAWTYNLDGTLSAQPGARDAFAEIGRDSLGLAPLPVAEAHGVILIRAGGGATIDTGAWFGGLCDDLDAFGLAGYHHVETRSHVQNMNWKLVIDTFLEAYHIFSLHKRSIAPLYFSDPCLFDAFGPHSRHVGIRRSILELAGQPEANWSAKPHATIHYVLVPNALVVHQIDHFEVWRVFPLSVDETLVHTGIYAAQRPEGERGLNHWRKNLDLVLQVTTTEDFPQSRRIQSDLAAGALEELTFGRNEPALQHFHRSLAGALTVPGVRGVPGESERRPASDLQGSVTPRPGGH